MSGAENILVGTASWTGASLVKSRKFYPAHVTTAAGRLAYYASHFRLVEVDSSYYALPSARNSESWTRNTPDGFTFNIKAFRLFTGHQTPARAFPKDILQVLAEHFETNPHLFYRDTPEDVRGALWDRFVEAIRPLRDAGKLGVVHFQFAPWVTYSTLALDHIRACAERLPGYRMAVEFRHRSWFDDAHRDRTLAFEHEHGLAHVVADEPQGFANSIPAVWEATRSDVAIVRLHGRNAETWTMTDAPDSSYRFNYDYSPEELAGIAADVRRLARKAERVHVVFNNNYEDQGQRNARSFMERLTAEEEVGN
ncbi:MAG: DUF72 domain-containing protein [Steroidobacteraceae bacterium]